MAVTDSVAPLPGTAARVGAWQVVTVESVTAETYRAKTLRVALGEWRSFRPGQHMDVRLTAPDGCGRSGRNRYRHHSDPDRTVRAFRLKGRSVITQPENYNSAPVVAIQCPRCGQSRDVSLITRVVGALEYAAVCSTPVTGGGLCSTTLRLSATSHVFAR